MRQLQKKKKRCRRSITARGLVLLNAGARALSYWLRPQGMLRAGAAAQVFFRRVRSPKLLPPRPPPTSPAPQPLREAEPALSLVLSLSPAASSAPPLITGPVAHAQPRGRGRGREPGAAACDRSAPPPPPCRLRESAARASSFSIAPAASPSPSSPAWPGLALRAARQFPVPPPLRPSHRREETADSSPARASRNEAEEPGMLRPGRWRRPQEGGRGRRAALAGPAPAAQPLRAPAALQRPAESQGGCYRQRQGGARGEREGEGGCLLARRPHPDSARRLPPRDSRARARTHARQRGVGSARAALLRARGTRADTQRRILRSRNPD